MPSRAASTAALATGDGPNGFSADPVADIQEILMRASRAEWLEKFAKARVPAGPINSVGKAAADAALQARGLFYALDDGERRVPIIGDGD